MGYTNNTAVYIFGKERPSYSTFTKILETADVSQIQTVHMGCSNSDEKREEQYRKAFRESFGFDSEDHKYIKISTPSKKEISDVTKKLWDGLRSVDVSLMNDLCISMDTEPSSIMDYGYEQSSAAARRIAKLGLRKSQNICHLSTDCVPEQISNESIDIIQKIIRLFRPSTDYCAGWYVERGEEGKSKILTLEELSQKLDKYTH
jgi:hypothetical protein